MGSHPQHSMNLRAERHRGQCLPHSVAAASNG